MSATWLPLFRFYQVGILPTFANETELVVVVDARRLQNLEVGRNEVVVSMGVDVRSKGAVSVGPEA